MPLSSRIEWHTNPTTRLRRTQATPGQAGGYVALSCRAPVHNFRSYLPAMQARVVTVIEQHMATALTGMPGVPQDRSTILG
jgi:hypothetical protein